MSAFRSRFVDCGEGALHLVEEGTGPAIVLLHGFPEHWYSWRNQIAPLAASGMRVLVPDLRGYNLSHKPAGLGSYKVSAVAGEIASLIRSEAPGEKLVLVGHDWGAVLAWYIAARMPELISRLVVINVPHPSALRRMLRHPRQLLRFWYQLPLQFPWFPERFLAANDCALMVRAMKLLSKRREALTKEVLDEYRRAWTQPDALRGMLNYYRAFLRRSGRAPGRGAAAVTAPVLLIHGERDRFFEPELFEASREWAPALRLERLPRSGHFAQQDEPERVSALIAEFATGVHP